MWQKLEEENADFFRAYYIRLKLKKQILLFNHLLEHQCNLMKYSMPPKVPLAPIQNGIHPMPGKFSVHCAVKWALIELTCCLHSELFQTIANDLLLQISLTAHLLCLRYTYRRVPEKRHIYTSSQTVFNFLRLLCVC